MKNRKESDKKYCLAHPERVKESKRKWQAAHPAERAERQRERRRANPEKTKAQAKEWRTKHPERVNTHNSQYRQTPQGIENHRKGEAKRRSNFGFVPLNKYFEGSRSHHVDRERVIYIPRKMHEETWHSVLKNINMEEINRQAFAYLNANEREAGNGAG